MARRLTDAEILAQIPAARARQRRALRTEPHAAKARYDRAHRVLHVTLTNGSAFSVPIAMIPGLRNASDDDIAQVDVLSPGDGLGWDRLNVDVGVAALVREAFGTRTLLRAAGAAGGAVRSPAKAAAARRNGRKGGRPRVEAG